MPTLEEVSAQAKTLDQNDRGRLLTDLLVGLEGIPAPASDEEIVAREREMDDGSVQLIGQTDFERIVRS